MGWVNSAVGGLVSVRGGNLPPNTIAIFKTVVYRCRVQKNYFKHASVALHGSSLGFHGTQIQFRTSVLRLRFGMNE